MKNFTNLCDLYIDISFFELRTLSGGCMGRTLALREFAVNHLVKEQRVLQ